jgi:hypothetical protein
MASLVTKASTLVTTVVLSYQDETLLPLTPLLPRIRILDYLPINKIVYLSFFYKVKCFSLMEFKHCIYISSTQEMNP